MGCCSTNEKCLIVTTINPIWHSRPVHPGKKFTICSLKSKENIIFAHNYFILEKHKQTKQLVVLIFNRPYFSSKED